MFDHTLEHRVNRKNDFFSLLKLPEQKFFSDIFFLSETTAKIGSQTNFFVIINMTDTLTVLKNIRQVQGNLVACKDQILNKTKKAEIERIIQELRLLEDSLLVKSPFMSMALSNTNNNPTPATLSSFRVYADNNKLQTPFDISQAAKQQLPSNMVQTAVLDVQQRQTDEYKARIESLAAALLPDLRQKFYGGYPNRQDLIVEVQRFVAAQPSSVVPSNQVDILTRLLYERLLQDAQRMG